MKNTCLAGAAFAAAALLSLICGCATGGAAAAGARDETLKAFTPMPSGSRWITPSQVSDLPAVVLAVVDFDFSDRDVAIRYCPAAFRNDGSGAMNLIAFEPQTRLSTVQQLHDEMAWRTEGGPVAISVLADGRPIGQEGIPISDEMLEFLRGFDADLRLSGIECAYLLPASRYTLSLPPETQVP